MPDAAAWHACKLLKEHDRVKPHHLGREGQVLHGAQRAITPSCDTLKSGLQIRADRLPAT